MFTFVTAVSESHLYQSNWSGFIQRNPDCEFINLENYDSIFRAYNEGLRRAKHDYVCFAHQDCKVVSNEFIPYIKKMFFENKKLGAVFMIGSPMSGPNSWSWAGQEFGAGSFYSEREDNLLELPLKGDRRILVGDGYCFVTRIKNILFDDNLSGFHFYDIVYSRDLIASGYELMVPGVPLTYHQSPGDLGSVEWSKLYPAFIKRVGSDILVLRKDGSVTTCRTLETAKNVVYKGLCYYDLVNSFQKSRLREWMKLIWCRINKEMSVKDE